VAGCPGAGAKFSEQPRPEPRHRFARITLATFASTSTDLDGEHGAHLGVAGLVAHYAGNRP
jgi:hypothetical protein